MTLRDRKRNKQSHFYDKCMENYMKCREDKKLAYFNFVAQQLLPNKNTVKKGKINEATASKISCQIPYLEEKSDIFNIPSAMKVGYYKPQLYGVKSRDSKALYQWFEFISLPETLSIRIPKGSTFSFSQLINL